MKSSSLSGRPIVRVALLCAALAFFARAAFAQTTSFTYQGKLTDGGTPATGTYDLQFALWDSVSSGTQIGSTQTVSSVSVSNGIFTVTLDFGANAFPGASRFLEISARASGGGSFTLLSPRQQITSTPYALRSLNASSADAVPVAGVPAGSGNYIQNTTSVQSSSNFNISGSGSAAGMLSANIVNSTTQYNLGGSRVLSVAGANNIFAGISAGTNTTSSDNAFFGAHAGEAANPGQGFNAFFGADAGRKTTGFLNADFGSFNSFFGSSAGQSNTFGSGNTFFGQGTGGNNTSGRGNAFFGVDAGLSNTTEDNNTFVGSFANGSANITNATAIGAFASVTQSNSLVLGSGVNVGIGTTSPSQILHLARGGAGSSTDVQLDNTDTGGGSWSISSVGNIAGRVGNFEIKRPGISIPFQITPFGYVGIGTKNPTAKLDVNGSLLVEFNVEVGSLTSGSTPLCISGVTIQILANCSSSLRYKKDVARFVGGLNIVNRLRPITFTWKDHPERDVGLAAEDVAKVEPRLVTHNAKGEIEGVKYDRLTAVLVNAIKEQQEQIRRQQAQIARQQRAINRLNRLVRGRKASANPKR